MTILNPEFRDKGEHPGGAAHWELRAFTAKERIAGFGPLPYLGWENFGRSWVVRRSLDDVMANMTLFGGIGFERFTQGWPVGAYSFEMPEERLVEAPFAAETMDWIDESFSWEIEDKVVVAFGVGEQESFVIPYFHTLNDAEQNSTIFSDLANIERFTPSDS